MKRTFLIAGCIWLLSGLLIYLYPQLFLDDAYHILTKPLGMAYAIIGLIAIFLYRHHSSNPIFRSLFLVLMFFALSSAFIFYGLQSLMANDYMLWSQLGLFLIYFLAYMKGLKPNESSSEK